jgi:hypothetical protein
MRVVCPYIQITKAWHTQNEKICQNLGINSSNLEGWPNVGTACLRNTVMSYNINSGYGTQISRPKS